MKTPRFLISGLCAAFLGLASLPSHAAVAVAAGDGNYTYTVTGYANLDQAKAQALEQCAREANNCHLSVWSKDAGALAIAKGKGGMSLNMADMPAAARDAAMANCRKLYKGCAFTALYWEPGGAWAAWAYARTREGTAVANYFASEQGSEAGARRAAIAGCEALQRGAQKLPCTVAVVSREAWSLARVVSKTDTTLISRASREGAIAAAMASCREDAADPGSCTLMEVLTNPGEQARPASFDKVHAATVLAREQGAKARPARNAGASAVRQLSCQNSCVNGNCVRTFADGRKERWQAPRVFDPFSNDWKWDTSSCGG